MGVKTGGHSDLPGVPPGLWRGSLIPARRRAIICIEVADFTDHLQGTLSTCPPAPPVPPQLEPPLHISLVSGAIAPDELPGIERWLTELEAFLAHYLETIS
jgi:hypothetical protein